MAHMNGLRHWTAEATHSGSDTTFLFAVHSLGFIRRFRIEWSRKEVIEAECRFDRCYSVARFLRLEDRKHVFELIVKYDSVLSLCEMEAMSTLPMTQRKYGAKLAEQ